MGLGKLFWEKPENKKVKSAQIVAKKNESKGRAWGLAVFLFLLALTPRLIYLFGVAEPQNAGAGWYGDTYHHWQIAYLTKEIGLKEGFLRLWDLKGMEYYWGILHPLLLTLIFTITGSADIVWTRLLSAVCGAAALTVLFFLMRRSWNRSAAWAGFLLGVVNPVLIFNDASGMVEPLGLTLLLAAIWFWPKKAVWTGLALVLAMTARAEAWLLALGILVAILWRGKGGEKKVVLVCTWGIGALLYMKILLDRTGNAIYPVWWNYFALAKGEWQSPFLKGYQLAVRPYLAAMAVTAGLLSLWFFFKKPKGWLWCLLGAGYTAFISAFLGLTAYLSSWEPWFWYIRFFVFPYMFAGALLAGIWFYWLPKRMPWIKKLGLGWLVVLVTAVVIQPAWRPIWQEYQKTAATWERKKVWAEAVNNVYDGGGLLFPEHEMDWLYALVRLGKVKGRVVVGEMFDPFYYAAEDPLANWGEFREEILGWLEKEEIRWLVVNSGVEKYREMIAREPGYFEMVAGVRDSNYLIYRFKGTGGDGKI